LNVCYIDVLFVKLTLYQETSYPKSTQNDSVYYFIEHIDNDGNSIVISQISVRCLSVFI